MTTTFTDYEWSSENVRVRTSTVQSIDSNKKPILVINCNGVLLPTNKRTYSLGLQYTGEDYASTEGQASGTFCIGEKVFNAHKIIKTTWDNDKKILTFNIDLRTTYQIIHLRKPTLFSFFIHINDFQCASEDSCD